MTDRRKEIERLVGEYGAESYAGALPGREYAAYGALMAAIDALLKDAERYRDLLQRSRRYVAAHDYKARGMQLGPPPVGGVLRDLIAAIDTELAEEQWKPCGHDDPSWCTDKCVPPWKRAQEQKRD